ncbi:hypothetical protein UK30_10315 [Salmonella enterica]|nr:hypothetical protein [Salmonella enterica]
MTAPRKHHGDWTDEEIHFVKTHYGTMTTAVIAEKLGRNENAVRWEIYKLNTAQNKKGQPWTEAEKKVIRTYFHRADGIELVTSILPWRTRNEIVQIVSNSIKTRTKKWTAQERLILEQYYPVEGKLVADRLPGRTPCAARSMANLLGIKVVDSGLVPPEWTQEEWLRLNESHHLPLAEATELFPGRTQTALRKARESLRKKLGKVQKLPPLLKETDSNRPQANNSKIPERGNNRSLTWTAQDLAFVKKHYGVMDTSELAKQLGRTVASIRITGGKLMRRKAGSEVTKTSEKHRNHRQEWTTRELRFVKTHYGTMKTTEIAKKLGRTVVSVRLEAQSLGCCKSSSILWTEKEEKIIRREYASGTPVERIMELLPGRTRNAIVLRAAKLKVNNVRLWRKEEEQLLKQYYPTMGTCVAEMLPGRTALAVRVMANNMGIIFHGSEESRRKIWSKEECLLLEKNNHLPLTELAALFPGRSRVSVRQALKRLENRRSKRE